MGLTSQHNATLFFKKTTRAEITNIYLEPELKTVEIPVKLSIEEQDLTNEIKNYGITRSSMQLSGRLLSPRHFSEELQQQREARIEIEAGHDYLISGKAYIIPIVRSRLGLESVFGDYIKIEVNVDE